MYLLHTFNGESHGEDSGNYWYQPFLGLFGPYVGVYICIYLYIYIYIFIHLYICPYIYPYLYIHI